MTIRKKRKSNFHEAILQRIKKKEKTPTFKN